jgi:hypothetical protein
MAPAEKSIAIFLFKRILSPLLFRFDRVMAPSSLWLLLYDASCLSVAFQCHPPLFSARAFSQQVDNSFVHHLDRAIGIAVNDFRSPRTHLIV